MGEQTATGEHVAQVPDEIGQRTSDGWGDKCPDCGGTFPFLYGPHPTWIPCGEVALATQSGSTEEASDGR